MTKQTTRRAILAGAVALPALSLPAIASEPEITLKDMRQAYAKLDSKSRAFMRALAKEYEEADLADDEIALWYHASAIVSLWPEWERLCAIANDAGWRMAELAKERAGFTKEMSGEERETKFRAALEVANRETGHSEKDDKFNAFDERVQVHVKAIEKLPARSVLGLAAKAIAAGTALSHAWDGPLADTDWDDGRARLLIEAVLTAAGVPNPFAVAGKAVQS
jgi:hypothetical protein